MYECQVNSGVDLVVNFMCQFACATGCPDEMLVLGVSVKIFLDDINI